MREDKPVAANLLRLSIKDIAQWHLRDPNCGNQPKRIALPKLQRGGVWKPHQVEQLWDSLLQGFPIGSFLLTPFQKELGSKRSQNADYHLLDGQQRSNSIALAFEDPLRPAELRHKPAELWIDLEEPPRDDTYGRRFVFRLTTLSHPWGYNRTNPQNRLAAKDMQRAIDEFQKQSVRDSNDHTQVDWKPGKIPLRLAWPWDAIAPVPFNLLIQAIEKTQKNSLRETLDELIHLLEQLPYWNDRNKPWISVLERLRLTTNGEPTVHVERIVTSICQLLDDQRPSFVPAVIVPETVIKASDDGMINPIETVFARFNTGGTQLGQEELIYSILKIIWPEAYDLVEGEGGLNKIVGKVMTPARLVMFTIRVALASLEEKKFPAVQKVRDFRERIHDEKFKSLLIKEYLTGCRMKKLLDEAMRLLKWGHIVSSKQVDLRLPSSLLSNIAQSSPDLLLLLLIWLDRHNYREDPIVLGDEKHKLLLAAVTTLHWFANDQKRCLDELFNCLTNNLWQPGMFSELINTAEVLPSVYPPLPSQKLSDAVKERVDSWKSEPKPDLKRDLWTQLTIEVPSDARTNCWEADDPKTRNAWSKAVAVAFHQKELLLYGQRQGIAKLFPDFDATGLDRLEDFDVPWDYDHIHPASYVDGVHNLHQFIRELVHSNGNLRVWPMEYNRRDQKHFPSSKLEQVTEDMKRYGLTCGDDIRAVSLIDGSNWEQWQGASPDEKVSPGYLKDDQYKGYRDKLVDAIISRTVTIYRNWFDDLAVAALFEERRLS